LRHYGPQTVKCLPTGADVVGRNESGTRHDPACNIHTSSPCSPPGRLTRSSTAGSRLSDYRQCDNATGAGEGVSNPGQLGSRRQSESRAWESCGKQLMKRFRWCCFAVPLSLQLGGASAQETPLVAPGVRVKVVRPDPGCGAPGAFWCRRWKVVGTLASVDSLTVVVRDENGGTENVPRISGIEVDVSEGPGLCSGRRRAPCVGAGLIGGAALGTLYGAIRAHARSNCAVDCGRVYWVSIPIGAVLGTLVGAVVGGEHWTPTRLPARLSLAPGDQGRLSLGWSMRF
jgi:hypothetical protein